MMFENKPNNILSKVLIISDERDLGEIYNLHLSSIPVEVVGTTSFAELPLFSIIYNPDLVLACISNSYVHLQVLKQIRSQFPTTKLIVIGMALDEYIMHTLMDLSVIGHVDRKNSHVNEVKDLVEKVLANTI